MGEREIVLVWQKPPSLEVKTNQLLIFPTRVLPLCILVVVYPPEIAGVDPTTEKNTYRMTINPFNTTYGPLR